jgi:FAD/FMN-containing dehydrogenase
VKRRKFLKIAAAAVACTALSAPSPSPAAARLSDRCRPGDPDWPDPAKWKALAARLQGRLVQPTPLLKPGPADEATLAQLHNPFFIQDHAGAAQSQGWMGAWSYGNSVYAVEAQSTADVVQAVNFARQNRLRLVVKGGGHDYLGRSNATDSLLIWTHPMRETKFLVGFVPEGSPAGSTGQQALMVSAGTRWLDAYGEAVTRNGRYVQGGGCTSVGACGGFIQGGGFGSFSKKFGCAAAGVLQAEVVLASGEVVVANHHQHPDLFWALRGGGGGTFGVVTKLYLKTHALPGNFGLMQGTITAQDDASYQDLLRRFVPFYLERINNEHWGEQIAFKATNSIEIYLVYQGIDGAQAREAWSPLLSWLGDNDPGYTTTTQFWDIPARRMWDPAFWQESHPGFITLDPRAEASKAQFWWSGNHGEAFKYWYAYKSWWLSNELFAQAGGETMAELLFQASRAGSVSLHINKGLGGGSREAIESLADTAVHPSAGQAAALVIMASGSNEVYQGVPGREPDLAHGRVMAAKIDSAMKLFEDAAPEGGSYANEADYFQDAWQKAFWGQKYERLFAIKQKVDPDGLFYGHHNAGSELWTENGMKRA